MEIIIGENGIYSHKNYLKKTNNYIFGGQIDSVII